jgi:hypothetical protein
MAGMFDDPEAGLLLESRGDTAVFNPEATGYLKTAAGLVPGFSDVMSVKDAFDSALKGEYGEAILNGIGVLPFIPSLGGILKNSPLKDATELFKPSKVKQALEETADPLAKERLVYMKLDDFLNSATKIDKPREEKIKSIKEALDNNIPLDDVPYLIIRTDSKNKRGQVIGHEGRHRAMVLKEMGYDYMPVRLMTRQQITKKEKVDMRNKELEGFPSKIRQQENFENVIDNPFKNKLIKD